MNLVVVLLCVCFGYSLAHPAFQHHFHKIVNSNKCTANCIKIIHDSELEISILKKANISDFLLDLDNICGTIKNASDCMAGCVHESNNPFALSSVIEICKKERRRDVELLEKCLIQKGSLITDTCIDECGNYDELNNEVHKLTMEMAPNPHDAEKAEKVLEKTNEACKMFKCSSRCSISEYNEECDDVTKDIGAGDLIQSIIESVLKATRRDLDKYGLVDTIAQHTPPECNYHYMPETMFNQTKDELSQIVIENMQRKPGGIGSSTEIPDQIHLLRHHAHQEISYSLSQLQNRLLHKQFFVLEEQQRNLEKEAKKLDLELELLKQKKDALDANLPL